jgi:hypothetical protein
MVGEVKFPDDAIGDENDLLTPAEKLLTGLDLLGPDGAGGGIASPPAQSVAILEANATALSKGWATVIAAVGGISVVTGSVSAFWTGQSSGIRIALIAGVAGVLAAAAIALAIIVSSDVRGRATGATAIYAARAAITVEFLRGAYQASAPPPPPPPPPPGSNGATPHIDAVAFANALDSLVGDGAELVKALKH